MPDPAPEGRVTPIFLHLPKTGGRTLRTIFMRQYGRERVYDAYASPVDAAIERYEALPEEEKRAYRALIGHVPIHMHEKMPGPCIYVTLLRHPVERVISTYYYVCRNPDHPKHEAIVGAGMSLSDVVRNGILPMVDNGQARVLANWWGEYGACPPEVGDRAMENIERHVAVAGLTARYDESLVLMGRELGWSWTRMLYVRRNVSASRPRAEDLPEETIAAIRDLNRVDLDLYRRVEERLDRTVRAAGSSFHAEVAAYRRALRLYGGWRGLRSRAGRLAGRLRGTGTAGR